MTKARVWPNSAADSRNRAAEEAAKILVQLNGLVERTNDPEVLRRIATAMQSANTILRLLEREGAPTLP